MPFPVQFLDKMIDNGINHLALMDYINGEHWFLTEQIAAGKNLSYDEFNATVFGLEQLDFGDIQMDSDGTSCLSHSNNKAEVFQVPLFYKNQTFTFSFCLFARPQKHLNDGTAHYTIYREAREDAQAFIISNDGKLETDADGNIRRPKGRSDLRSGPEVH